VTEQPPQSQTRPALLLSRADVTRLMTIGDYRVAAEEAFRALAVGRAHVPPPMHIPAEAGAFHAKGAQLDTGEGNYAAVKVNANFPSNPQAFGLPTIQGAIILSDARNGVPLAIMDSMEITLRRTAAATALAASYLARPSANTVAICGCGRQADAQLAALADEFSLERVLAWDIDPAAAAAFARRSAQKLGCDVEPVREMRDATKASDIIVTCTTAHAPFLDVADVSPGAFIAAIGADNHDKNEIAPALMAKAKVVVDILDQCVVIGDLRHAIEARAMSSADVHATLGELVVEQRPARTGDNEIWLFDSTGSAAQDVAAALRVYDRAKARGIGLALNLND